MYGTGLVRYQVYILDYLHGPKFLIFTKKYRERYQVAHVFQRVHSLPERGPVRRSTLGAASLRLAGGARQAHWC